MEQPFIPPKDWCLPGGLSKYGLLVSEKSTVDLFAEPTEKKELAKRAAIYASFGDAVVAAMAYYERQQALWWQASFELESYSQAEEQFKELAAKWRKETKHISSLTKTILHPAYQRIIGMGPIAIKLILQELERKPHHWFWALESITGENPVRPDDDFDAAVAAWLRWGRERGLI